MSLGGVFIRSVARMGLGGVQGLIPDSNDLDYLSGKLNGEFDVEHKAGERRQI